jgi:homoserine O-acetyltransferase
VARSLADQRKSSTRRARTGIERGHEVTENRIFELGDFQLQKGAVLPNAKLGYVTVGELNAAKDNVVVCPTWFTATPADTAFWMTGPQRALDPQRYSS